MPEHQTCLVERLTSQDVTLCYFIRSGSRSRPYRWFDVDQVPHFEGPSAYFEIERIRGGWRVLRQVDR